MENIRIVIYGEEIFVRARKEDETREEYREYLEERYEEEFPHKNYSFFRLGKRIKQFNRERKAIDKLERKSYAESFKENEVNYCSVGFRGLLGFIFRAVTNKIRPKNEKNKKETKKEGFFSKSKRNQNKDKKEGFFSKFKKNKMNNKKVEEEFEENLPELEEEFEEEFKENLPELEEEFKENLPELEEEFKENLPELEETKKEEKSLPIEIKSWRNLTPEEARNINMMAQLRLLQDQNKQQVEAISSAVSNFKLYQENIKKLEEENMRLRREVNRLSYNPNSFIIKNAYEEAMKENERFDFEKKRDKAFGMLEENYGKSYKGDLTANPYNIGSVSFIKDENEKAKILTKYNDFKNNSTKK